MGEKTRKTKLSPLALKAIELRKQGKQLKEIARELDISHARVSMFVRRGIRHGMVERFHTRRRYIATSIATGEQFYFDGGTAIEAQGFSRGCVWLAAMCHQKTHGGFTWQVVDAVTQ